MEYIKKVSKLAKKFIDKQDRKQRERIYISSFFFYFLLYKFPKIDYNRKSK